MQHQKWREENKQLITELQQLELLKKDLEASFGKKRHERDSAEQELSTLRQKSQDLEWKLERLSLTELNIIRLSVYELCVSSRFDSKTIINEYISIFESFSGNVDFANGILDNISRQTFMHNE